MRKCPVALAYQKGNEAKKAATPRRHTGYHPTHVGKDHHRHRGDRCAEFLTRCAIEVASLQAESAARRLSD